MLQRRVLAPATLPGSSRRAPATLPSSSRHASARHPTVRTPHTLHPAPYTWRVKMRFGVLRALPP
eukprot:366112-Chlamydomonas_euryale.AAC.2